MKALDNLLEALKNDERIIAYKKLETLINENEMYQNAYQDLLNKQKRMVQSEHYNRNTLNTDRLAYEKALKELENNPVIHQYLTLQEEINEILQSISTLLESAIKKPFNES
ncbi:MAG: YlbF family regulator [Candidatus Izemoplasmataceae bacterium]